METFGGFDCAISPFIRTMQGKRFKSSKVKDLNVRKNTSFPVIPQILTNNKDDFIHLAKVLFDMGYVHINLNMGCPVPTASGRGRGAGLLLERDFVDRLLEDVLSEIPNRLSIKTRIGFSKDDELLKMIEVFNRYPLQEVTIHPRTAKQKYQGSVNLLAFKMACEALDHEVIYSGDINTREDLLFLQSQLPHIRKWMIGLGILKNPYLIEQIRSKDCIRNGNVAKFLETLARISHRIF